MSLTITELQAVTDDYILKHQPEDIFFRSNVLLFKLLSLGKTYDGGKKIQANLEYDRAPAGSYGPTSELPIHKKEIITAAYFNYAAYFTTLTIDMDDELMNSGDAAIVNLVVTKMRNAEKSIRESMAQDVYKARAAGLAADPKARPFYGLPDIFNQSDSFKYGEIAPEDLGNDEYGRPLWKAGFDSTAQTMSFKFMQSLRRRASINNNNDGKPNLYITTEVLADAFERTLQTQARYSDVNLVNAGFDNVLFKGAPVVSDDKQADGYIDALNTRFLEVRTHSKRNFTKPVWQSPIRQPDTATANIRYAGQILCTNRKAHARATNVSEPA